MAEEEEKQEGPPLEEPCKCPECPPGLPGWMATFSDLVTLLLTFFVLLLSFAKTESAKYEAALGSIRNAFGGNVLKKGEVIQLGKSTDNQPTMVESQAPVRPFPIEFLTMEGMLNKHEVNRDSTEVLDQMKQDLGTVGLAENVNVYEQKEGILVQVKDKVYFKNGTIELEGVSVVVLEKIVRLAQERGWNVFVKGHASVGETYSKSGGDAYELANLRATLVAKTLMDKGVAANKITIVSYGDSRPVKIKGTSVSRSDRLSRRVEFAIRKVDLETKGRKVDAY
jgi:chemotaxis protein MotB